MEGQIWYAWIPAAEFDRKFMLGVAPVVEHDVIIANALMGDNGRTKEPDEGADSITASTVG